jgi:hypothetical protein
VLRALYQQLQRGEPLAPVVRATRATTASRANAQDRDANANGAHAAGAAAIAARSSIALAVPPSAASPPEQQPTLQLLQSLVALLATPLPVACHSCATRATTLQRQLQDDKGGGDGLQQALAALQLDGAAVAEADVAGRDLTDADNVAGAPQPLLMSAARLAIHTRVRLTMEPHSFQLNFLRALPDLLLLVAAEAAANKPHPLHVQLRSLLRAYTRELDFRVDEEALLLHCGVLPPPAASGADSLFLDPSAEGGLGGLYFPAPPELVASRLFGFHAPILHALLDLVSADPTFAPIELSQSQQRYFKDQWLASPPAADEMAELVNLLKAQDIAATFASASAASSTAMDAVAAQPLAFSPLTDATWLRFVPVVGGEESVLSAAEAACAEARAERRQRRREKREAAEQEQKQRAEQRTDGTVVEQDLEEKQDQSVAALAESSSKIPHDDDDDIIMLSQAPHVAVATSAGAGAPSMLDDLLPSARSRSATVATAAALPVSASSARPRRHSADLSSTRCSSGASTPASTGTSGARAQDPVEVAARLILGGDADTLQLAEECMPAFDEPEDLFGAPALEDDEDAWDADSWDSSQSASQHAQLAAAPPVTSTISLDDAFAEASQRVRQQAALSASQEAKEEKHATDGQMEEDARMYEDDTLQPKSPVAVVRSPHAVSPPPGESLLTQLDMLRSSLPSDAMMAAQPTIISALSSLLAEEEGGAITPASVLSTLQSRRDLAHLYSKLASVAAVIGRFRDCASAFEFDAACARADLASLESPPSLLLFFALFLDSNLAHARVRTLLSSAVLPTLRAQLRGKNTSVNKDATGCLLLLVLRGHEEALVHSVLVPLLVETMNPTAAADAPDASATFDLLKSLFWEPKSQQKQQQQRTAGKSAAAPRALSASSRVLLLQHFCSCSLRRFEPQARSNPNSFRWSDAEQSMLMTGFLDSRGSTGGGSSSSSGGGADAGLPAPHPEHHASLLALATGTSAASHVLPQLLSASSASVSSSHAQSAGDVGALLLACMILACANESLRKQSAFTLLLLAYANMARGLMTAPPLQQTVKALSGQLGGMLGKRFLSALAKGNAQSA